MKIPKKITPESRNKILNIMEKERKFVTVQEMSFLMSELYTLDDRLLTPEEWINLPPPGEYSHILIGYESLKKAYDDDDQVFVAALWEATGMKPTMEDYKNFVEGFIRGSIRSGDWIKRNQQQREELVEIATETFNTLFGGDFKSDQFDLTPYRVIPIK